MAATELGDPRRMVLSHPKHECHPRAKAPTLAHRLWLVVQSIISRLTCEIMGCKSHGQHTRKAPAGRRLAIEGQSHVPNSRGADDFGPGIGSGTSALPATQLTRTAHGVCEPSQEAQPMTSTPIPCSTAARKSFQGSRGASRTHRLQGKAKRHRGGTDD